MKGLKPESKRQVLKQIRFFNRWKVNNVSLIKMVMRNAYRIKVTGYTPF